MPHRAPPSLIIMIMNAFLEPVLRAAAIAFLTTKVICYFWPGLLPFDLEMWLTFGHAEFIVSVVHLMLIPLALGLLFHKTAARSASVAIIEVSGLIYHARDDFFGDKLLMGVAGVAILTLIVVLHGFRAYTSGAVLGQAS